METVHHYEGTVNQAMGDGIRALFGAPLALETMPSGPVKWQKPIRNHAKENVGADLPQSAQRSDGDAPGGLRRLYSDRHSRKR